MTRLQLAPLLAVFSSLGPLAAQVTWTKSAYLGPHAGVALVGLGPANGVLLCGGFQPFETWIWDGATRVWSRRVTNPGPPAARSHPSLAFDWARNIVVLHGGRSQPIGGGVANDTWEWDGTAWSSRQTASPGPHVEQNPAVYDAARQRTVLVAGAQSTETWEWDGVAWSMRVTSPAPLANQAYALAYDPVRQRTVLFGGYDYSSGGLNHLAETWEWDGASWLQRQPAASPPGRRHGAATFDPSRARVVLYGGRDAGGALSDTWEWDGVNWQQVPTPNRPPVSSGQGAGRPALAYDHASARCILRLDADDPATSATWAYDGSDWTIVAPATSPSRNAPVAYDTVQSRLLAFDQDGALWSWDGVQWTPLPRTSPWPSARLSPGLCFDPQRGRLVLFGGQPPAQPSTFFADTWEWDGVAWIQLQPAVAPPPRVGAKTAFDSLRGRVVMFGGFASTNLFDLWAWDGASWSTLGVWPGSQAAFNRWLGLAYDAQRDRLVTAAHYYTQPLSTQTWEWDSSGWVRRFPANDLCSGHDQCELVYDARRGRTVAVARCYSATEWDGTNWTMRTPVNDLPGTIWGHSVAFDSDRRFVVAYGGIVGPVYSYDVWTFGPTHAADYVAFGAGCAGSAGVPLLRNAIGGLPWLGDTFVREVSPVPGSSLALLVIGLQTSQWNNTPLPLGLQSYGAPGCTLHVGPDVAVGMATVGAAATLSFVIPSAAGLLGIQMHDQCLVLDPGANALGAVVSNAATLTVGGR